MGSQQVVYMPKLNLGLYPDVLTVAETPQYFDKNEVLLTNPLIIIELLSKGTGKYDRTLKFEHYKTLDSFQEYVIIDPNRCYITTHFREEPGDLRCADHLIPLRALVGSGRQLASALPVCPRRTDRD